MVGFGRTSRTQEFLIILIDSGRLRRFGPVRHSRATASPRNRLCLYAQWNGDATLCQFALEQAVIPGLGPDTRRTWNLALYNVLIDGGSSLGALGAGFPLMIQNQFNFSLLGGYRVLFLGYSGLYIATTILYSLLSPAIEVDNLPMLERPQTVGPETKTVIAKLAALFSRDAFGGGFLTDALVSYWFFRRFGLSEHDLGLVFFAVHVLNALSHLVAAWLARRVVLVSSMVFTHLPSSLFLMAVPLAPSAKWAIRLFFHARPWWKWMFRRDSPTSHL